MKNSKNKIKKIATGTTNEKAIIASYAVSLLIAKSGKPYNIGEELIMPAAKSMCSIIWNETAAKEISLISLPNDIVKKRVDDMSENVHSQLILRLKSTEMFSLQLDESTDFTDKSHLLSFVVYEHEKYVIEDHYFAKK